MKVCEVLHANQPSIREWEIDSASSISCLLRRAAPFAVLFAVVAVIVDALKLSANISLTHVMDELLKAIYP